MQSKNEIVLYQPDEAIQLEVRLENETVWLSQQQMSILFEIDRTSIVRHINNIYRVKELDPDSTCVKIAQVQLEGGRTVRRNVPFFNLDMIISVGFRVNSKRGIAFRQWALGVLKDHSEKIDLFLGGCNLLPSPQWRGAGGEVCQGEGFLS